MNISLFTYILVSAWIIQAAFAAPKEEEVDEWIRTGVQQRIKDHRVSYHERYRPQIHYSPPDCWLSDPNGLFYYDGEWHIGYQNDPEHDYLDILQVGWGHAVSSDLVHWTPMPPWVRPNPKRPELGPAFSGGATVDLYNQTGFQKSPKEKALIAAFIHWRPKDWHQTLGLSISNDRGRTWEHYEGNPVIDPPAGGPKQLDNYRDPNVLYHEKEWILSATNNVLDDIMFYKSKDMKNWERVGTFGHGPPAHGSRDGGWECPSLNPIVVENSEGETKWLLVVNSNNFSDRQVAIQYFVGEWNGTTFINDNPPEEVNWLDYGPDNYAYVPFANDPKGRRVFLGWMSNWMYTSVTPTSPWRNAVTIPRTMRLRRMDNGRIRPVQLPVEELHSLRISHHVATIKPMTLTKSNKLYNVTQDMDFVNNLFDIEVEFDMSKVKGNGTFGLRIGNHIGDHIDVGYDMGLKSFIFDRRHSGVNDVKYPDEPVGRYNSRVWKGSRLVDILNQPTISMRTILDVTSMELFGDGGLTTMSGIFFPTDGIYYTQIYLYADLQNDESELGVNGGVVYGLKSIWP